MKNSNTTQIKEKLSNPPVGIEGVDYNVLTTHANIQGLEYRNPLAPRHSFTIAKTKEERQLRKKAQKLTK